ncbi:hypothetical protein DFH27DRAFT_528223 [Peziza echinospora]|nr:hypothetical protein DFH27DRAFT_528223 [Peziza echinospora]
MSSKLVPIGQKQPYVEDYNSMISEVVPMTRRGTQSRGRSGLANCEMASTDSGYASTHVSSEQSTTLSPIASRSGTPENDDSQQTQSLQQQQEQQLQRLQQLQKEQQEHHQQQQQQHQQYQQQHQQQHQQPHQQQQQDSQRDQRGYSDYQNRDYQRYQQGEQSHNAQQDYQQQQYREQPTAPPMTRRASSHFSSQASSQLSSSSSNPTPSGSRHNSVKAKSRPASPVGHKHDASTADPDCDCSECRTATKGTVPSALSTPWNLNYAPFNSTHPTPPYGSGYAVSPMRGTYDYYNYPPTPVTEPTDAYLDHRRPPRDRPMPARPLSYGGSHPVSNTAAWSAYNGYYMQNGAAAPVAGAPVYAAQGYPPPINTAVPAPSSASAANPYSAAAGGYSAYPYSPGHDYWATSAAATAGGAASGDYNNPMPPPPIPARRASNRMASGLLGSSPRASSEGYHGGYSRRYAEEYSERYPRGYGDDYSRRHADEYEYPTSSPITRRMSQRNTQGSGAYSYLREEVPRSTSVPPAGTDPATPADAGRRRTVTPQPTPPSRSRRDSTSTSNSAGVTSGALARVPRPGEIAEYDEYTRTPPTTSAVPATTPGGSSSGRYPPRTPYGYTYDDYGYSAGQHHGHHSSSSRQYPPTTPLYRGSDSSGTSSGAPEPENAITSDGENDGYKTSPPARYKGAGGEADVAVHYRQPTQHHSGYTSSGGEYRSHHHGAYREIPASSHRERERGDREERRSGAGELSRKKSRRDLEYNYSGRRRTGEWR